MNIKSLYLLVFFLIASLYSFGNDKLFVRYTQSVNNSLSATKATLPDRSSRMSTSEGNINIVSNVDVPDSIFYSVEMASKLWQTKINNAYPISLQVEFSELNCNEIFIIEIASQYNDGILYPVALHSHLFGETEFDPESPNAILILNSSLDWNCSFDADRNVSGYNVLTQALRAISICYGFGSSVINDDSNFRFYYLIPTIFDKHLYYSSNCIDDYNQSNDTFKDIVLSNNVEYRGSRNFNMSSENENSYNQLIFLNNENSLMHSNLRNNAQWHYIDDNVIHILNDLGWNIRNDRSQIVSKDLDEKGYGSAYTEHSFQLETENCETASLEWAFSLRKNDGNNSKIKESNDQVFTTPSISSIEDYYVDINGNLCGEITCSYIIDGVEYSASPYHISLGIKPVILSIDHLQEIALDEEYKYRLDFIVNYRGADYVTLMVEEKNNTIIRSKRFNEAILAHIQTGDLSHLRHTWVDIKVSNEYGSSIETIEMPINFSVPNNLKKSSGNSFSINNESSNLYKIYNLNGTLIQETYNIDNARMNLPKGIYIIKDSEDFVSKIVVN